MDGKVCTVCTVCTVSWAGQGLGASIALGLAAAGAVGVVITGGNMKRGEVVGQSLRDLGARAQFLRADFGRVEECRHAMADTDRLFDRMDVPVNAGDLTDRGTILDTSPELFDRRFAVNVRGPIS